MENTEVDVHEIVTSMNKTWTDILGTRTFRVANSEAEGSGVIRSVPRSFGPREDFNPKLISIGPLHYGRLDLNVGQQVKWSYLYAALPVEIVVKHVKSIEDKVRQKYADGEQDQQVLQSHKFVEMLVLDGCFIFGFMLMLGNYFFIVPLQLPWSMRLSLIRNDLLLLENQIPFFLLLEMFKCLLPEDPEHSADGTFVVGLAVDLVNPSQHRCPLAVQESPENIHHLLHLYHMSICPTPRAQPNQRGQIANMFARCNIISLIGHFIDIAFHVFDSPSGLLNAQLVRFVPTATELDEIGVRLKRKEKQFGSFLDVKFDAASGVMEIPVLTIDEGTRSLFRNLIVFEQTDTKGITYSPRFMELISSLVDEYVHKVDETRCGFNYCTSYVVLMSKLMDRPEDVTMLERCGIIVNNVGSDKQVADLFNDLCTTVILDKEHYLMRVFEDVKRYSGSKRQRWKNQLIRDYFGNPWKTMSVIAAVILLILTMLQTFYTVYAYYHPRTN